ncbi:MAG: hypothetical protein GKR93_19255 [Gammaproteobacteria bacterium]|nr:hypothetical protein [Gammaproteobacteria bacterium]
MTQDVVGKNLSDDFSRVQIPETNTYTGIHIGAIIVGGVIGIPAFLQASQIGSSLGLERATVAFLVGCFVLGSLGALTSYVGARTRFSTYMLTEFAFGRSGAKFVNFIIALSLVGWYGVISNVFAEAADLVIQDIYDLRIPLWIYVVSGSTLMTGVTISGFKGIDRLSLFLVPVMMLFLFYAAYLSWDDIGSWNKVSGEPVLNYSTAISSVVGGYIVGVVIQPDYSRFAKNIKHAMWAVFIALWIVQALVFFLAAIPSVATGESDLIRIMVTLGIGVPAFLLLLLSSWCSNVLCLYSSGLSMSTILVRAHLWQLILTIGIIGTAIAFMYSENYFISFLVLLGVAIPPVASIYVLNVILLRKGVCEISSLEEESAFNKEAFIAWLLAVIAGYTANEQVFSISGIATIDSIVIASLVYCGLNWSHIRRKE